MTRHDDEIVVQITGASLSWSDCAKNLSSDGISPEGSRHVPAENREEITSLFKAITDPWDIHIGTASKGQYHWTGPNMFFELPVDAFMQYKNASKWIQEHGEGQSARPVFEFLPKFRVVCLSPESFRRSLVVKRFKDRVVATHDIGPRVTSRLLNVIKIPTLGHRGIDQSEEIFAGKWNEFEECQQLIIDDVCENAGGKLDARQQLFVLVYLKTKLRDEWKVLDEEE
ncbi:hypothetical protein IFR05_015399 [Cadophora sp. M221]|nr:hypothetical protein IFR05_015399 [Cadophora sp. M221]